MIISIVGLLLGSGWYYTRNWKTSIRTKLENNIAASSKGLYNLTYDDIAVNLLRGEVKLKNVELTPDSITYDQLVASEQASNNQFYIRSANLTINGIGIWNIILSKKLNINKILFDTVEFHLTHHRHPYNDSTKNDSTTLYDKIKEAFKIVKIGEIQMEYANFKFSHIHNDHVETKEIDSIQVKISDFLLDERSAHDNSRILFSKNIETTVSNFTYDIPNSPYKVQFGKFYLNSKSKQASFYQASLVPRISKAQYFQTDTANKALITLKLDSLYLEEIDLAKMMERRLLHAKYAYMKNGSATFEKDKRYQQDNVNKIGQAPHQQVMKLKQLIRVDTIFVTNIDISYSEYSAKYNQIGTITFQRAKGNITNLTNDVQQLRQDKFLRADLRTQLMGTGALHAYFGFDMLSDVGSHSYKGTLGHMQAPAFNRILGPLLRLEFASGNIHKITFDMQGTDFKNWGEFRFDYDAMKVDILHKPAQDDEDSKKRILSFFVNQFVINNSNPNPDGTYRIGKVNHTRVPEYSHFKTIWKALYEGIQQSVGLNKAPKEVDKSPEKQNEEKEESKNMLEKTGDFLKGLFEKKEDATVDTD